jgi:peptidoglycan hydrolase-like protein with peptidoglycan-binding domain
VNGAPVVLLVGDRPAWRDLVPGIDDGEDIRQLEQALSDLGYATSALEIDDEWTSATTASVKNLQEALGTKEDGKLLLGEFVFTPAAVRIAAVDGHEGDKVAEAGIEVTGEVQVIEADADTSDADIVTPGTSVTLELPNGDEVPGTIYTVGAPESDADGNSSLPVVVLADGLEAVDGLDVEIKIDVIDVAGATAVPAEALLALAEGGYAVEVPDESSATGTRLVAVELGAFDEEGWVQVTGDVVPGDQVVVP